MHTPTAGHNHGAEYYEIRVRGHLAARWARRFDGMTLTRQADGTTVIHGLVADQAALHGLLNGINAMGVVLISVTGTGASRPATPAKPPTGANQTEQPNRRSKT